MLFSSVPFLYYFLPVVIICYLLTPKKLKNAVLLLSSLFFYAWGERRLVLMLMGTIVFGYVCGLVMELCETKKGKQICLVASILVSLGLLGYFKYVDFFIDSFNHVTGLSVPLLQVALPIGISFYTFQILSYTIDVYRGQVRAQKSLVAFAAYVSLFPQLIAGPIVRYADIEHQLHDRQHTVEKTADGVRRFLYGLGKKVLLANAFGELTMQFRSSGQPSVLFYWLYAVSYMLQIYYDFSGYSDMAIGLGKMFGFTFLENFDYPYIARSITEFWRRWHISLGAWFRDYVYIPLGGNRKGIKRQLINILVVWMLTGLWHGASWNFVLWGLFYAVFLMIEKMGLLKWLQRHPIVGHVYTIVLVLFGFVLFNAQNLSEVVSDLAGMTGFLQISVVSAEAVYALRSYGILLIAGILGATPIPKLAVGKILKKAAKGLEPIYLTGILLIVTAYLVDGSFNPFLYFRF